MFNNKSWPKQNQDRWKAIEKNFLLTTLATSKSLYHIINKINGCIEESNENKYFTLVPSDKSKDILKNMKNYGTQSDINKQ